VQVPGPGDSTDPVPPIGPVTPDPVPPVLTPEVPVKQAGILWGRWVRVNGLPTDFNLTLERARQQLIATNGNYAILRTEGQEYVTPERGGVGFTLADSEAFVVTNYGTTRTEAAAALSNGKLDVDFGSKSFTTSFDAATRTEKFSFSGDGIVTTDGRLYGNSAAGRLNFVNAQGLLTDDKNSGAAYIFDSRIDDRRTINGGTLWAPTK